MKRPRLLPALARCLLAGAVLSSLLAGCADPNARAVVVSNNHAAETIKDIDVYLVSPGKVGFPLIAQSMELTGWSSGEFARKFCDRLAKNFLEKGIRINKVHSFWGPDREMNFGSADPASSAPYQMIVAPIRVSAMLPTRYGKVLGPTDGFIMLTRVIISKNKVSVWEARQETNVAPIDPTGAERFSIGILNSMADSGLVAAPHAK